MGSIQTAIQLQDNFTNTIMNIIDSVNLAVSSMVDMSEAMNADIDTSSIDSAREHLNQASAAATQLTEAMANVGTVSTPNISPTPAQPQAVQWQTDNISVFTNEGVERYQQEIQSVHAMLNALNEQQRTIDTTASGMDILPDAATQDLESMQNRIQAITDRIQEMENTPINTNVDVVNNDLEHLRTQLNQATQQQNALNQALNSMDVSEANAEYLRLSQTVANTERYIRDTMNIHTQPQTIQWRTENVTVFTNEGVERYQQEIQSVHNMLNALNNQQAVIDNTASGMDILPSSATQDITNLQNRIQGIASRIQELESNPMNLNTSVVNNDLEHLRTQLSQAIQQQNSLNQALENMDANEANNAYLRLSQTIGNTERYIRDNISGQQQFNNTVQQGTTQANSLMNMIQKVVGAYATVQTAKGILNASDGLAQTTARLNLMNENFNQMGTGVESTQELFEMIYVSAENARSSLNGMTDVVARFGNNAKDAFGSSAEVVQFANLVQKQMKIAGASTTESANAMLQLSQALGSGVLRGDELNSIFEQAPNLIQGIADYLDVPIGKIRSMAKDGELTADIVKASVFASADEINSKFESMPRTWDEVWTSMKNTATMAFQPVLERINDIANSEGFQNAFNGIINAMAIVANVTLNVFDIIGQAGTFAADNWSVLEPIVAGGAIAMGMYTAALITNNAIQTIHNIQTSIAAVKEYASAKAVLANASAHSAESIATARATVAQASFNTALLACPLTWIIASILMFIVIIYAVVAAINKLTNSTNSAAGIICGTITMVAAGIWNVILGLVNMVIGIGVELYNLIATFANFFANVFNDPVGAIIDLFSGMFDFILGVVQSAADLIDTVLGSDMSSAVAGFRNDFSDAVSDIIGDDQTVVMEKLDAKDYQFERVDYIDAFGVGYDFGEKLDEKIKNFDLSEILGKTELPNKEDYEGLYEGYDYSPYLDDISGDTDKMSKDMELTGEDLKYIRDIAERDIINRFTTAEIKVDMTNNNSISKEADIDGITNKLYTALEEQMNAVAEGVY